MNKDHLKGEIDLIRAFANRPVKAEVSSVKKWIDGLRVLLDSVEENLDE